MQDMLASFSRPAAWKGAACALVVVVLGVLGCFKSVPSGSFGVRYLFGVIEELPMEPGLYLRNPLARVTTAESSDNLDRLVVCDKETCATLDGKEWHPMEARYWNHVNVSAEMKAECALNSDCLLKRALLALNKASVGGEWRYEAVVYEKAIRQAYACVIANNYAFDLETNPVAVAKLVLLVAKSRIRFPEVFVLDDVEIEHFSWPDAYYNAAASTYRYVSVGPAMGKVNQDCALSRLAAPKRPGTSLAAILDQ
jgi:hypothetical protein